MGFIPRRLHEDMHEELLASAGESILRFIDMFVAVTQEVVDFLIFILIIFCHNIANQEALRVGTI